MFSECLSSGPIHSSSSTPSVNWRFSIAINFSKLGTESLSGSQPGVVTGQPPRDFITSLRGSSSIISICAKQVNVLSYSHSYSYVTYRIAYINNYGEIDGYILT